MLGHSFHICYSGFILLIIDYNEMIPHYVTQFFSFLHFVLKFPHQCTIQTLTGKRQEPQKNHPHGLGRSSCLHRLLDPNSRLCHHHSSDKYSQLHPPDYHLALLHCPGLHQQVQTRLRNICCNF